MIFIIYFFQNLFNYATIETNRVISYYIYVLIFQCHRDQSPSQAKGTVSPLNPYAMDGLSMLGLRR